MPRRVRGRLSTLAAAILTAAAALAPLAAYIVGRAPAPVAKMPAGESLLPRLSPPPALSSVDWPEWFVAPAAAADPPPVAAEAPDGFHGPEIALLAEPPPMSIDVLAVEADAAGAGPNMPIDLHLPPALASPRAAVPEPAALAVLMTGVALLALSRAGGRGRRRSRR